MSVLVDENKSLFEDMDDDIPFLTGASVPKGNKWLSLVESASAHTPDFRQLKNGKLGEFIIFVCDNLQKGRAINYLLNGAHYYGRGETVYNGFVLKKNRDGVPTPFRMKKVGYQGRAGFMYPNTGFHVIRTQDVGAIEGDVYGVPLRLLATLDNVRKNTEKCNRQTNLVRLIHPRQNGQYVKSFVWEGDHDYYEKFDASPQFMATCSMKIRSNVQVLFS